ncbi:hypothetical protein [Clostridium botulinum]|uniref:hypothetical protein n=1 Tax=Clostridium botulinum TaxID=1491 RepID=UPI0004D62A42|nr:hypothetical protein [Clostridium botulinum]KEH97491.1 hypothetical protein Z953_02300 [Clostridium botulinum D str. 16868]
MINSNQYYISGKNTKTGPVFMYFDVMFDTDGIPSYSFRAVPPRKTGIIPLPDNAVNIVLRVLVYKNHSTFRQIYQYFFWNPVTKCFRVSGPYDSAQVNFVPCTTIGDSNPPSCCCCHCCSPCSIPTSCTPSMTSPCCGTPYSYNIY